MCKHLTSHLSIRLVFACILFKTRNLNGHSRTFTKWFKISNERLYVQQESSTMSGQSYLLVENIVQLTYLNLNFHLFLKESNIHHSTENG